MAKIERTVTGDFHTILNKLHNAVMAGSVSITYEDGSEYKKDGMAFAVRVYERYSYFGSNRVSLTITIVGGNNTYHVTAITAGGSRAMFFKINRVGEKAFLNTIKNTIENL